MKTQPSIHLSFRFDPEMRRVLDAIQVRDGIPVSEQVRRAIQMWIDLKRHQDLGGLPVIAAKGKR